MANQGALQKIMGVSSSIEMIVRRVYWNKTISKFMGSKSYRKNTLSYSKINFNNVIEHLRQSGIQNGDILIVHSAFGPLKSSGLSPDEIIDKLIDLVGSSGTLCMPVIRKYSEHDMIDSSNDQFATQKITKYNTRTSKVWTGILPRTLMRRDQAVISRFPLNTLCALGHEAEAMMQNELNDELPAPNGVGSAWKYCTDHNAWVISIGTDLTHSLTMIHTAEDVLKSGWPVKDWYNERVFEITDDHHKIIKTVLERDRRWGMLHFGERKLSRDLLKDNILASNRIDGLLVEHLESRSLFEYLNEKNSSGYPYFWLNRFLLR